MRSSNCPLYFVPATIEVKSNATVTLYTYDSMYNNKLKSAHMQQKEINSTTPEEIEKFRKSARSKNKPTSWIEPHRFQDEETLIKAYLGKKQDGNKKLQLSL